MEKSETPTTSPLFRSPTIFENFPKLIAAESTRHGGVSEAPYNSLNLGGSTGDLLENILENNHRFFQSINIPFESVAKSHQVHGSEILIVNQPGRFEGYDALITNIPDVQLAVTVADCTPILIYDPATGAVAAIHAGWRGTASEIVYKTVRLMNKTYGTRAADCVSYIGTCIDECSFEVGEDVAKFFISDHKRWDNERGKFFVDLKKANQDLLLRAGLKSENMEISAYSTVLNNDDYFSYRYEKGVTGRMLATIGRIS